MTTDPDLLVSARCLGVDVTYLNSALSFAASRLSARDFATLARLLHASLDEDVAANLDRSAALRSTVT
jgi:hypothetical protein